MNKPKISVIMPAYNAQDTIGRAIRSVLNTPRYREIEIILVDDCSKDKTCEVIRHIQKEYDNVKLYSMAQNSGGPSGPRNLGIEKATGEYVTFLDDDDWVDSNRLMKMVDYAIEKDADFLKGYLIVVRGGKETIANKLPTIPQGKKATIEALVALQSMTQDYIVKRKILLENNLKYPTDLKIGEDTVFITNIFSVATKVEYLDDYFLYYNQTLQDISNPSSTQRCGNKEIKSQIDAWKISEKNLEKIDVSYYEMRLHSGFRNLLISIVRYSDGISADAYMALHEFACETKHIVRGKMNLHSRYQELYEAILAGNYEEFLQQAKTRILINGYDLKFILPVIPYLEKRYSVKVDEWTGHNSHDEKKSRSLAQWADIIWCEWLLGNAVFYSKLKNNNQRLIIRFHRFEITRDFGFQIDYSQVDMFIAVGYYYFEQFAKQFFIPRAKMRLLSNYVEDTIYSTEKTPEARYHIGLVGILPARKGFHRGLELLRLLKKRDERFQLHIMGKTPQEVPWVKNNPAEADYFQSCESYICENGLSDSIVYGGFVPREKLYGNLGYVLSLSDNEWPESFHLAPAEGACAGSMGLLLKWPGAEYVYHPEVLCESIEEMAEHIYRASQTPVLYEQKSQHLRAFVLNNYGMNQFLDTLQRYLNQLYVLE